MFFLAQMMQKKGREQRRRELDEQQDARPNNQQYGNLMEIGVPRGPQKISMELLFFHDFPSYKPTFIDIYSIVLYFFPTVFHGFPIMNRGLSIY